MDYGFKALSGATNRNSSMINRIRVACVDIITSISKSNRTINTKTHSNSEIRGSIVMLPYGISSSGVDGIKAQVLMSDDNYTTSVIGVYDTSRPPTEPGEVVIYTKHGQRIQLLKDGNIVIGHSDSNVAVQVTKDTINFISKSHGSISIDTIIQHIIP